MDKSRDIEELLDSAVAAEVSDVAALQWLEAKPNRTLADDEMIAYLEDAWQRAAAPDMKRG